MLFIAQTALFLLAFAGVVACSLGMIYFAGGALNKARQPEMRQRRAALAVLCLCGIVASAGLGFVGVPLILYFASP
ncbi:MAG: hypothetical protein AB7O98_06605 [Hyphomonadaceae bacterium]